MTTDDVLLLLAAVLACIALAAILAAIQLSAMRRSLQAITYRGAMDAMKPYWALLAQYPELYAVLHGGSDLETLSQADRVRAEVAWNLRMDWHQSWVVQDVVYGGFSQAMADNWTVQLRDDLRNPAFDGMWERLGGRFHPAMRAWVSTELAAIRAEG